MFPRGKLRAIRPAGPIRELNSTPCLRGERLSYSENREFAPAEPCTFEKITPW
jgi:hypothetical protein